jgi:autotransporter family porin
MRVVRWLTLLSIVLGTAAGCALSFATVLPTPGAGSTLVLRGIGAPPLSDADAARRVARSDWEPRPGNAKANHRRPTRRQLAYFHEHSDMPYARFVTGNFRGTTDEILQWGAYKRGFSPDLLRAVATVESWWHESFVGDGGDSFGLMQVRRPYHCCLPIVQSSTAFNVDYYGGILRAYFDGAQGFLNEVPHGELYAPGDLWGSIGVWASGRWHLGRANWYAGEVRKRVADQVWLTESFRSG